MYLCIPRVNSAISKEYIHNKLCNLNIGTVEKMSEIPLKNDAAYKRIIFKIKWNKNETSQRLQECLVANKTFNIVYDMPWFWKVVITNQKP